jgi:endonuclease/exonuclease/phosphatase family metal-dependent hydrolase
MHPLRIITLNTAKCDGDYSARVAWMAEELRRLSPDLVALQEVFRDESGKPDTGSQLAAALGMTCTWAPARFKRRVLEGREVSGWSGMALLSNQPWDYIDTVELPADPRDGDRVAQVGLLDLGGISVVAANLHLTHLRDSDGLRREQLDCVLNHPLLQMKRAMRLLAGDFNSGLESYLMRELLGRDGPVDVKDTFVLAGGRGERRTLTCHEACVDYILSLAEHPDSHPLFTSSAVVFKAPQPETGVLASDHFGVATTLVPARMHGWLRIEGASFD